ncbi:MAG TPA: LLM class flavin-dependent oxidoreductase [Candidatus Tectomicrobia bacterium]|jgi:alkanesulfonate monooxygenase SsuD/methylene tetrahydromethanopterin reductase-like flavin-dependent oxidoreductase (luciferase family)|nr:LLM class flavin-dependent oxidoreductase [Candidatus Tectomicrobia bacterium]
MDFGVFIEFPCREGMTEREAFTECFALADEAEALGVDSVWLAEYHFSPISVLSSPITIASAIAARTRRIRIGLAVILLPLGNPIRLAEDIATLDHISQGRVEFGVGRGTFPDTHDGFNSPYAESRERFDEYLEIILKAWTTERFSFTGKHYHCEDLYVRPKPLQTPHPPIRVGITSEVTFPLVGRMGFPIIINPSRVFALSELGPYIQQYRRAWHDAGHAGTPQVGLRVPLYVAETAERAYEEPKASTMMAVQGLGNRVAGSASRLGTTGDWSAEAERLRGMSYDDWLRDKVVYGTPEVVVERLQQLTEELDLTQILYEVNYGRQLPYELQLKNLRLINERVIPEFK